MVLENIEKGSLKFLEQNLNFSYIILGTMSAVVVHLSCFLLFRNSYISVMRCLAGKILHRYEASAVDADDECFMFPIIPLSDADLLVNYTITSEEILVRMNLRSDNTDAVLRSRLLPARFKQLYEDGRNLTESYRIEFCASSELMDDDAAAAASAVIFDVENIVRPGW